MAPQAGTGVGAHRPENPHPSDINPNAQGDPSRGSTRPPAWNPQASLCLRPEAGRTNFTEPVALDSILETPTAFWLCNVHSQPWPVALGCLSLVMRLAYVFRRPWGETRGRRWGTSKSNNSPPKRPCAPLAAEGHGTPAQGAFAIYSVASREPRGEGFAGSSSGVGSVSLPVGPGDQGSECVPVPLCWCQAISFRAQHPPRSGLGDTGIACHMHLLGSGCQAAGREL